jgi:hypothetical protein
MADLKRRLDRLEASLDTAEQAGTARDLWHEVEHKGAEAKGRTLDEERAARGPSFMAELKGLSYPELIRRFHGALRRTFTDA